MTIRVVLADDHSVVRDGLRFLLEAEGDIVVVGAAATGREVLRVARDVMPDVIVMDLAMPMLNGTEATLQIRQALPATRVLILSMHSTTEHIYRAFQAGAQGYVLKESAGPEVVAAVRAVHAGRRYLSQKIAETVLDDYVRERHSSGPLDSLSARERQILQLVAEGKTTAEAASVLFLSPKTVETYRSRVMHKLGVRDFAGLVRFAVQHGLTPLE
ncbi:MAG TPA: response regulator transcription factor [Casimicrobiaceae bacterium]|nr:response regulator transcription factor [Casimicrobiaceae bacterium]